MTKPKMKKMAIISLVTGLMTMGALWGISRSKSSSSEPIPPEKLTAALRENWDDDSPKAMSNIVKNINFPFFMAVDKNGQFSEKKAQKIIDALNIDKNRGACQSFLEGVYTFDDLCEALIGDDKAKEQKLAPVLKELKTYVWENTQGTKNSAKTIYYDCMKVGSGIMAAFTFVMLLGGAFAALQEEDPLVMVGAGIFALGFMYVGTKGLNRYERLGDELRRSNYSAEVIKQGLHTVQQDMYNAYVRQTIDGEKAKIIRLDQEQSKQMMKWIQENDLIRFGRY